MSESPTGVQLSMVKVVDVEGGKCELIPSGQMYDQVNGEKSEMGIVNVVGAKSYLVCVEPKVEQMGQNAQLCNQAKGETS